MSVELPSIGVSAKTFQDCFTECIYEVPKFQRPYSWEDEQLQDYWRDVIGARGELFFGTIVTWVSERRDLFRDTYALIDGQQRLTTSAIALSVVRDALKMVAVPSPESEHINDTEIDKTRNIAKNLENASQRYLVATNDFGEEFPIVKRSERMFWDVIQSPNTIPSNVIWDESARRIGQAREFFEEKVSAAVDSCSLLSEKVEQLTEIRNSILRARLIQVELEKEEDAFLIFETLNTRGAELQLRDLVKNDLVRGISNDSRGRENVVSRWNEVMDTVVAKDSPIDAADSFIWQSWNSRREAVRKNELYKALRQFFDTDKNNYHTYLTELENDSQTFTLLEGNSVEFPKEIQGVRNSLSLPSVQDSIVALNIFNVSVANSAVLALVRAYNMSLVSKKNLERAMQAIENFHFQFTQLASSSSTGGTRQRYNAFATQLENARNSTAATIAIDQLIQRLRDSAPAEKILISAFQQLFYAPSMRLTQSQKKRGRQDVIRYVLLTMARDQGTVARSRRTSDWTIEHIRPQSHAEANVSDPAFSIGNLTLLTSSANGVLANGDFVTKRSVLGRTSALKDDTLISWLQDPALTTLTDVKIVERTTSLAEHAIRKVWAI